MVLDNAVATNLVFSFDHAHEVPPRKLTHLLGGKGAGLAEMTSQLQVPVPPGFTISLDVSRMFMQNGWPASLDEQIEAHMRQLGERMGRSFGDPADPLLVAVRSGAPVSMPGMLDTVLNLGINEAAVEGLARVSGDEVFAWDSYRRFIEMFATTVMGVEVAPSHIVSDLDAAGTKKLIADLLRRVEDAAGRPVPDDPRQQLREAIEAVFRSWDSPRARVYRAKERLSDNLGTAVNVQAMVFGNRGPRSGTGVVFTRNPSTGTDGPYGDYLAKAQGEEVVAGTAKTMPITSLKDHEPEVYDELLRWLRRLEVHYSDMCDIEFTVEDGKLWLLQTRVGKRGAVAAVRLAVALTEDPDITLSKQSALKRADAKVRKRARAEILSTNGASDTHDDAQIGVALGASPGRVSGAIVVSSLGAISATEDVILVRPETSPEDVAGMAASVGILTAKGGLVSHAAVVARGWGIPAVVGASDVAIESDRVLFANGVEVAVGEVITIDGTSGQIWRGVVENSDQSEKAEQLLPELQILEQWEQELGNSE